MKKMLIVVLAVVLVFAFATTAFAGYASYSSKKVFGGSSQEFTTDIRSSTSQILLSVSSVTWNGQSSWKMRGYSHQDGSACTALSDPLAAGSNTVSFTSLPAVVTVKTSIASSVYSDYLYFSGYLSF